MNVRGVVILAEKHPVIAGVSVFGVGLILLYMFGGLGKSSGSADGGSSNASAFYAAESAQNVAGDQLQATQIGAQASTTQALASDAAGVTVQQTWAATDLAESNANNSTAITLAPFEVEGQLVNTLGAVAALPPVTTVSNASNGGFSLFGLKLGGSNKTTTTTAPSPAATAAGQELSGLLNGFVPGH